MCLRTGIEEVEKRVKKLHKVFPVWKVMYSSSQLYRTEFDDNKTHLLVDGINVAAYHQEKRSWIPYQPGFHAFLRLKDAKSRFPYDKKRVRKFWAKKKWIITCGYDAVNNLPCVVLSKISTSKEAIP